MGYDPAAHGALHKPDFLIPRDHTCPDLDPNYFEPMGDPWPYVRLAEVLGLSPPLSCVE